MPRSTTPLRLLAAALGISASFGLSAAGVERTAAVADFSTCAKPEWPKEALRKEQTGTVTLAFLIDADGSIGDSKVTRSSGFPLLDEAAINGLRRCHFKPGTVDGRAASAWMQMQYVWTIEGPAKVKVNQQEVDQYRATALAGDPEALYLLAKAYSNGAPNQAVSLATFRVTLDEGLAQAQFELAHRLSTGTNAPQDHNEAAVWVRKAAEEASPPRS